MRAALPQAFSQELPLNRAAFLSWLSMKPLVMVWLWYLNVLYWVALFYWPKPEAVAAVVSYVAVAPLVVWMIGRQRGLTRLSGLIHLPWIPFAAYLGVRLFSDELGPRLSFEPDGVFHGWLVLLFWSTVICLAFDVLDVMRWLAGQRYVLGTPAAAAAGASKLAPLDWNTA